ncbi:MAG: ATP phosphoribosyltransferase regulatory subunit [Thermovibrio sp.]|nr:MAG: ATP phosphoribosyltransferase regulatory subunit [Thermovibrio sp.]
MGISEIPKGFRSLLREEVEKRNFLLNRIREVAELWGYEPLSPPTIEFLDTFKVVDENLENISFKLVDRFTGKLLAVRPDFTPQVARIVASSLKNEEPPFRFYYSGKIFRDSEGEREIVQFGFELIGVRETEADAEIVSVVANVLKELGLKSFQIDIGHTEFLLGAVEEISLEDGEEIVEILRHKDFSGLELFCEKRKIVGERREKLERLLELYGGVEILREAEELFKGKRVKRALEELYEVYEILKGYGFEGNIIFDLSERRGMEYQGGITFEIFHPLYGFSLGGGGRYNRLIGKFGRELPATGIAINLDALQELLERKNALRMEKRPKVYVIDLKKELQTAYRLATELRKRGIPASRDIVKRDYRESVRVAFEKGFSCVVVLNVEGRGNYIILNSPNLEKGELKPIESLEKITEDVLRCIEKRQI